MPTAKHRVSWIVPDEVAKHIALLAELHNRSVSGEVVTALQSWVRKHAQELDEAQATGIGAE